MPDQLPQTEALLRRAHSPNSASRIYTDKIQHRALYLRPTSPPPAKVNARTARRQARERARAVKKLKPKPLSSRERRRLGLHDVPKDGHRYDVYEPLTRLWAGYAREVLDGDVYVGGPDAAAKLASAEFHGAEVEVVRSKCPSRVGIRGIVVRDRKFVMEVITRKRGLKVVPKEGTTFRVELAVHDKEETAAGAEAKEAATEGKFVFEIGGDQMLLRSADRANRKFKARFLKNV